MDYGVDSSLLCVQCTHAFCMPIMPMIELNLFYWYLFQWYVYIQWGTFQRVNNWERNKRKLSLYWTRSMSTIGISCWSCDLREFIKLKVGAMCLTRIDRIMFVLCGNSWEWLQAIVYNHAYFKRWDLYVLYEMNLWLHAGDVHNTPLK